MWEVKATYVMSSCLSICFGNNLVVSWSWAICSPSGRQGVAPFIGLKQPLVAHTGRGGEVHCGSVWPGCGSWMSAAVGWHSRHSSQERAATAGQMDEKWSWLWDPGSHPGFFLWWEEQLSLHPSLQSKCVKALHYFFSTVAHQLSANSLHSGCLPSHKHSG